MPFSIESSRRLPLRDAVEKRPLPIEYRKQPDNEEVQDPTFNENSQPVYSTVYNQAIPANAYPYILGYNPSPNQYLYTPTFYQTFPQQQQQTLYNPLQFFQSILSNYRVAAPYRIGNGYQQLLANPFAIPQGRSGRQFSDKKRKNLKT